ncbi:MAG TPA: hypothetical protein EYP28_00320 [Methanophagales archaeon]|nr:hypothetical protein [Methanophagales archaeon]
METGEKIALAGVVIAVISLVAFVAYPILYNPQPTPATPTPTSTAAPPLTPYIIDTMDSTSGWETDKDDKGSTININQYPGGLVMPLKLPII